MADAPELRTARLLLSPLAPGDVDALHSHWTEPGVRRFLWDGRTVAVDEVREVIRTSEALFASRGAGLWAIRPLGSATLVGCGGFWYFHDPPELELLLGLSEDRWGEGLARESAVALLDVAFGALEWPVVQASADAPNRSSLALMRRLGMRPAGERPGEFGTIEVFQVTREEWRSREE